MSGFYRVINPIVPDPNAHMGVCVRKTGIEPACIL